jgi:type I restriction enzyme M protein
MLDSETKRRIDTARDILVGKVPDPKSQVEQITIALIYKFMDDMDAESEELGGERKFFAGEFAKYGWAKLMRSGLGGHEILGLYADAIARMPQNPGIPPLFRDIFKNAYLPYRDPETLRAFLKIIDDFEYDHSERLGDAFEYLLSVLGSQGEAGQFRTPRHIIDFIVSIVNPMKNETVLDPACGTAGFLISSYKHILAANRDADGNSTLTPDERTRLAGNFKGYDISPDMVRLSLANMYLHGFTDPHIYEYDTLTSQDRWNEYADVILANPPFMSPKGGIKPHNRFSVQSKRSEVLFVDYMAEHLTPGGRAGIIVPEGIIFQGQTAYRQLRKMLVEDHLIGVISLPSGVFMPYTGVKTSILVLDRVEARRNANVIFSDVRQIGFSLGVKRTPTEHNDLPAVLQDFRAYRRGGELSRQSWLASREAILANGVDLTGSRHRPRKAVGDTRWVEIGEVCGITKGTSSSTETPPGPYPLVVRGEERLTSDAYQFDRPAVCVPSLSLVHGKGQINRLHYAEGKFAVANLMYAVQPNDVEELDCRYLYYALSHRKSAIADRMQGAIYVTLKPDGLATFEIPYPPLETQKEIVAEIEGYQKVIDGARTVVECYRPSVPSKDDWPEVRLADVCSIRSGGTPSRSRPEYWGGDIPWVTTSHVNNRTIAAASEFITQAGLDNSSAWIVPSGTVVIAMYGQGATRGRVARLGIDAAVNQACALFLPKDDRMDPAFLFRVLQSRYEDLRRISESRGGNQSNLSATLLKQYKIPCPPLEAQVAVAEDLGAEQTLVDSSRELSSRLQEKIDALLTSLWG